jgi:diguanylate cyclase (GGDEF)-like protein/PAS domain S-box-containing protein
MAAGGSRHITIRKAAPPIVASLALAGAGTVGWTSAVPTAVGVAGVVGAWVINEVVTSLVSPQADAVGLQARIGAQLLAVTVPMYLIGWGPVLGVGYLYIVVDAFRKSGSRAQQPLFVWLAVSLGLGQAAIAVGLVGSLIRPPLVHGVAALAAVGLFTGVEFFGSVVRAREASEHRFGALIDHSSDVIVILAADGVIRYASPAARRLLGCPPDELVGRLGSELVHPDDQHLGVELFARVLRSAGDSVRGEIRVLGADGRAVPSEFTATNLLADDAVAGIVINMRDVSERKAAAPRSIDQARCDGLTGLPNRVFFEERLAAATARAGVSDDKAAVLVVDLDRFADIEIRIGRALAERLLGEVAERLEACVRPNDCLARLGDHEFGLLVRGMLGPDDVVAVAARVTSELRAPLVLDATEVSLTASVGIALCQPRSHTVEPLCHAQSAVRAVNGKGGDGYALFDPGIEAPARRRLYLQAELLHALERQELEVYYQPIVDLCRDMVAGFEALVRWNHPRRGILLPSEFIGLAEDNGAINAIGSWVLEKACRQASSWDPVALDMHVNLSARQLLDPALPDVVAAALAATQLQPSRVVLEITETVLMDDLTASVGVIEQIRSQGVRFAIDDFGAGYSSFAYLRRLPTEILKLDRCLIEGLGDDPEAMAVVETVVALAHRVGMLALAEGVERPEQLLALRAAHCDLFQGFCFSRPIPAGDASLLVGEVRRRT